MFNVFDLSFGGFPTKGFFSKLAHYYTPSPLNDIGYIHNTSFTFTFFPAFLNNIFVSRPCPVGEVFIMNFS